MSSPKGNLRLVYDNETIERAIDRVALRLRMDLEGKTPVFVCVLRGAIPFTWDLMRRIPIEMQLEYISTRSYVGTTGGELHVEGGFERDYSGKVIVLIDDVLDRGITMKKLKEMASNVADEVLTVVLVDKKEARQVDFDADYVALEAEDLFLVGRGMDVNGRFRNLEDIYVYEEP